MDWFDKLTAHRVHEREVCKIVVLAWCIWNARCDKAFSNNNSSPDTIIQRCKKEIAEYEAKSPPSISLSPPQSRENLHWSPPSGGVFKMNVDGSFINDTKTCGIGLIIRDFAGVHWGSKCISLTHLSSPEQAECRGLLEATQWQGRRICRR